MTFDENSQGGDLSTQKQTARDRTKELSKNQWKGKGEEMEEKEEEK